MYTCIISVVADKFLIGMYYEGLDLIIYRACAFPILDPHVRTSGYPDAHVQVLGLGTRQTVVT